MVKKYAVLIAVSDSADDEFTRAAYVERDAAALADVLALHGYEADDRIMLIDERATKAVVESTLIRLAKELQGEDRLILSLAGPVFAQGEENYLVCRDTQAADRTGTSVSLAAIFRALETSACESMVLFLDLRPARTTDALCETEIESFAAAAPGRLCFAACRAGETSHVSERTHRGVWSDLLVRAFNGEAALALARGLLTAESLQKYLTKELPRALRLDSPHPGEQTPWMCGEAAPEEPLADLRAIVKERRDRAAREQAYVTELSFVIERTAAIRNLSGWRAGHRLPVSHSGAAHTFAAGLAEEELKHDLDAVYASLKRSFGYARRDLETSILEEGAGTIATPHFNYSVAVTLNRLDPAEVIWTRTVDTISSPEKIASSEFAAVFDGLFDTLHFSLPQLVSLEDLIDAVEAADLPDIRLNYDRELTFCELQIPGLGGVVRLKPRELRIVHERASKTAALLESFALVRRLVEDSSLPLLSFSSKGKKRSRSRGT